MKFLTLLLACWLSFFLPEAYPEKPAVTVYLFLGEECKISQSYTLTLRELYRKYSSSDLQFIGLFPNPSSSLEKMAAFQEKYHIPFLLTLDALQTKMNQFGVKVTPEVVVFDHTNDQVLYQGRIDNTFFRVGKRRQVTTTFELEDVLRAIVEKEAPQTSAAPAVGCFITPIEVNGKQVPICVPSKEQGLQHK